MAASNANKKKCILFLGKGRVGKTSLIKRILEHEFTPKYRPTVEDIFHREFEINNKTMDIEFMDTSGSYDFPAMRKICISKASAFVLVFSVTDSSSLTTLSPIINQIQEERADYESLPLVVAGNKIDLREKEELTQDDAEVWMTEHNLPTERLALTSAKEEDGVWEMYTKLWEQYRDLSKSLEGGVDEQSGGSPRGGLPFAQMLEKRRFSAFAVLTGTQGFNMRSLGGGAGSDSSNSMAKSPRRKRNSRPSIFKTNGRSKKETIRVDCVIS